MVKNPVMFVVEVGRPADHYSARARLPAPPSAASAGDCRSRCGCGSPWCLPISRKPWRKAAARPKPTRCARRAAKPRRDRLKPNGSIEVVPSSELRADDVVVAYGWRVHPRRRRSDRRRRFGGRIGDHRRIRSRHSRSGRRPLGGHRRHARALRRDQGAHHLESRRNVSRSHDPSGRRRVSPEDAQRNRAEHSARRTDHHLPAGRGHACSPTPFTPARRRTFSCWSPCWSA